MKVKLLEYYQDAQNAFKPEQEADVDDALGAWLVEHRKAVKLEVVARAEGGEVKAGTPYFVGDTAFSLDPKKLAGSIVEGLRKQEPEPQPEKPKRGKRGKQ